MNVKIVSAALDTMRIEIAPGKTEERLVLRGVIEPTTLDGLLVDTYQREILSGSKVGELKQALRTSIVPDIELGMRGERTRNIGQEYFLLDPVYIIDGLQRTSAARELMNEDVNARPRIGVTVHFDTNYEWEKERFRILNQERSKVSSNILLRNAQSDFKSVDMLSKLCSDESFALSDRVQWQQRKLRSEVISAMTFAKVVMVLHAKFSTSNPGQRGNYRDVAMALDKVLEKVGRTTMRDNIKDFFGLIDECFGVRKIVFTNGAVQVKETFLLTMAEFFSDFEEFWRGDRFFVDRRLQLKIAKFPISDPEVMRLASSGGQAGTLLHTLLVQHVNSGKRSKRLRLEGVQVSEEEPAGVSGK